jgi:hypothetical protein
MECTVAQRGMGFEVWGDERSEVMQGVMRMKYKGPVLFHSFHQGRSPVIFVVMAAEVNQKGR